MLHKQIYVNTMFYLEDSMKRWWIPFIGLIFIAISILSCTAVDPENYSGQWYSSCEQCTYLFSNGLIYCQKYPIPVSEADTISGAYMFAGKTIFLFAEGIDGLENPRELFLVKKNEESLLCENKDGTGQIFFARDVSQK